MGLASDHSSTLLLAEPGSDHPPALSDSASGSNPSPLLPLAEAPEAGKLRLLRECIDATDEAILSLLNRRAAYSLEVGNIKSRGKALVFRPAREKELLHKLLDANKGPLKEGHVRAIYREILSASRALQGARKAAFPGPEGAFSHMAALDCLGRSFLYAPMAHLKDVFHAVVSRDCVLGLVPLENSLDGGIGQSLDLFAEHDVHVLAEHFSRIRLSLLSLEVSCAAVQVVYSHAQALGQCSAWLREHCPGARQVSLESTVVAAHRAAQEAGSAAIAHAEFAEQLCLPLLASNIEDQPDNWTRFFLIGPEPVQERGADKSSLLFVLADRPGSLATVLNILAGKGINLSKLESRPLRGKPWEYLFFADLDCDITAPEQAPLLAALHGHCLRLRVLGAYPSGVESTHSHL